MVNPIFTQLKSGNGHKQVICFPYLGGYANSFLQIIEYIEGDMECWALTPPGHGGNSNKPIEDLESLIHVCFQEIQAIMKPRTVFFGHSMGGIVAYFLAQRLISENRLKDINLSLVLSACNTPRAFLDHHPSTLSDEGLIEHLLSYNGIPDELANETNLLSFFLPVFRADFKILESSATHPFEPIDLPVSFLWGENDPIVPIDSVIEWKKYFQRSIELIPIKNGTHMFVHDQADKVGAFLSETLANEHTSKQKV